MKLLLTLIAGLALASSVVASEGGCGGCSGSKDKKKEGETKTEGTSTLQTVEVSVR